MNFYSYLNTWINYWGRSRAKDPTYRTQIYGFKGNLVKLVKYQFNHSVHLINLTKKGSISNVTYNQCLTYFHSRLEWSLSPTVSHLLHWAVLQSIQFLWTRSLYSSSWSDQTVNDSYQSWRRKQRYYIVTCIYLIYIRKLQMLLCTVHYLDTGQTKI